jgi:hypothetical protein
MQAEHIGLRQHCVKWMFGRGELGPAALGDLSGGNDDAQVKHKVVFQSDTANEGHLTVMIGLVAVIMGAVHLLFSCPPRTCTDASCGCYPGGGDLVMRLATVTCPRSCMRRACITLKVFLTLLDDR